MKSEIPQIRYTIVTACILVLLLVLVGCTQSVPEPVAQPEPEGYPLPDNIRSSGILRVGSQGTYVPAEFREEGTENLKGYAVDLLHEVARRLGLQLEYIHADYSALIPGIAAGRFDMGSGGMSPNPDRLEAVDMVAYFQSGATFIIRKEDEGKYSTAQDFCGKPVGAIQGATTIEAAMVIENEKCVNDGKSPVDLQYFTTTSDGLQQVLLGRIDAYLPDFAQTHYIIQQDPDMYASIGENYYLVKYLSAWTFPKGDGILRDAVANTLSDMMADGTYMNILNQWGVSAGAISKPAVNSLTADQN